MRFLFDGSDHPFYRPYKLQKQQSFMPCIWWQQYTTGRHTKGFKNHQWCAAYRWQRQKNQSASIIKSIIHVETFATCPYNISTDLTPYIIISFCLDEPPQCLMLGKF